VGSALATNGEGSRPGLWISEGQQARNQKRSGACRYLCDVVPHHVHPGDEGEVAIMDMLYEALAGMTDALGPVDKIIHKSRDEKGAPEGEKRTSIFGDCYDVHLGYGPSNRGKTKSMGLSRPLHDILI
jgi:hypothetical protein